MIETKPWYQSKTLWLNIITIAVGVLSLMAAMPELERFVPWLMLANGVLNIVLRVLFTNEPIRGTPAAKAMIARDARGRFTKGDR